MPSCSVLLSSFCEASRAWFEKLVQSPDSIWYALLIMVNWIFLFDLYLDHRQYHHISKPNMPVELKELGSEEEYQKSRIYGKDKLAFGMVSKIVQHIIGVAVLFFGAYPLMWQYGTMIMQKVVGYKTPLGAEVCTSMTFQLLLIAFGVITSLPFGVYETFWLERKHGFNKTTVKTFVMDLIKGTMINGILGLLLVGAIVWIIRRTGDYFAIAICSFIIVFQLVMIVVYPTVIQPLFNKFTILADSELKNKIQRLAEKVDFPLKKIFVMDGSKRSSHSNAYFFGFFKNKRIVLYDTLIEQMSTDEIVSVVGHELGHWAHSHMIKTLIFMQISILGTFYLFKFVMNHQPLYAAFGFGTGYDIGYEKPLIIGLTIFQQILAPLGILVSLIGNAFSRSNEFQADRYAIDVGYGEHLPSALAKLYNENKSLVHPDWLYSALHYSHPPPSERLQAMKKYASISAKKSK